ncbi:hypothetical protein [Abyssibacter profundi]|uniref:Uncharacterized protein n=1 Tax=Abyssibacter profundi TaxID=2182787 RepID=A0A383XQ37_9GAMM|nr:hypothetical protein [Abyssibacter profundi]PWN54741.1 hypothetical protein DEH80_16115 [Abyssibacter profundi]|tara:strand:- start:247 stop:471 length:225 start_codon:yes stop_codon:yes gene_type:complete
METVIGWFLAGMGFSLGVLAGAFLNMLATKQGRNEIRAEHRATLDLLERKCIGVERVAFAIECMTRNEREEDAA